MAKLYIVEILLNKNSETCIFLICVEIMTRINITPEKIISVKIRITHIQQD